MRTWRDLTAFVLLAHLVTLSKGNIDGAGAFEDILSKNVSIVLIDNKANGLADGTLGNFTLFTGNNVSTVPETTGIQDERLLETKLEKALETAASLGPVIVISPPADETNSTDHLTGPVILIGSPVESLQPILNNSRIVEISGTDVKESGSTIDQETSQSRVLPRSVRKDNADYEGEENLKDILAITEYEPQRLDTKRFENVVPQPSEDSSTSKPQVTKRPFPEQTHYDVPKRKNPSKRSQSSSRNSGKDTGKSGESSNQDSQLAVTPAESQTAQTDDESTNRFKYKFDKQKTTSSTPYRLSSNKNYKELSRDSEQSDATTKSTFPRKWVYSSIPRSNNLLGASSSDDVTTTSPSDTKGKNTSKTKKSYDSSGNGRNTQISSPWTSRSKSENKTSYDDSKDDDSPWAKLGITKPSRRYIEYVTPDYVKDLYEDRESASNDSHGYRSRYSLPSSGYSLPDIFKKSGESKQNQASGNTDESTTKKDVKDSNEGGVTKSTDVQQNTSPDPYSFLYLDQNRHTNARIPPPYPYENDDKVGAPNNNPIGNVAYSPNRNSQLVPTTPGYDVYADINESVKLNAIPKQQKLVNDGQQRRVPINSADHTTNFVGNTVPSYNLINNPVYQLRAAKINPGVVPVNTVYNPYNNFGDRKPIPAVQPENQNTEFYIPRGIDPNSRGLPATYQNLDDKSVQQALVKPVVNQRIRNSNYVDNTGAKPNYDLLNFNHQKLETPGTPLTTKQNTATLYRQQSNNPLLSVSSDNRIQRPLNPRVPAVDQRISNPSGKVLSTSFIDSRNINEGDVSDERTFTIPSLTIDSRNRPLYGERTNQQIREAAPNFVPIENEKQTYNVVPSSDGLLLESTPSIYPRRRNPKIIAAQDRVVAPSHAQTYLAKQVLTQNGKSALRNYVEQRYVPTPYDASKSINRADILTAALEDEVPAGSGHKEHTHKGGKKDHNHETAAGEKHEKLHHESHGEKGDKGYKGWHEYDKGDKGHHDKEDHDNDYVEKKGGEKKHEDESAHHEEHHDGEKGNKEAEYGEKGEHQKGHSTKGQHVVHKKDEYEKKTEFYDESHEEDGDENGGEYHHEHESEKGGSEKAGHHDAAHKEAEYGEKAAHEEGHHHHEKKGHDSGEGHQHHHKHDGKHGKKGALAEGKKWAFKKSGNGHGGGGKKAS